MEINERLDRIAREIGCSREGSASLLNALHACRPDHPWYDEAKRPYSNLKFMMHGRWLGISCEDRDWLAKMAKSEEAMA